MGTLQPKLRFPEFNGDWVNDTLGNLFNINAGGDIKQEFVSQIKNETFKYPIYANAEKNKGFYGYSSIYKIDEEVITIAGRGVNIGIAHARKEKFYPIVRLLVLKPKFKLSVDFFEYAINQFDIVAESTGVPQLTAPQISNYGIFYTDYPEQTKIANFLSSIDKKLNLLKEKKALLEEYKKGIMQKFFSLEIRFKDENGNDFEDWQVKSIGNILSIGSGRDYKHLNPGNVPVYGTGGLMTYVDSFLHQGETVCIGRKGTIDKPMYFNGDIWTVDTLFYTHTFVDSIPKYVFYVFQSINWKQHNEASGVPSLSKSTIEQISINVPSVPEQTKIADFLSAIDQKTELVSTQIEETQGYKKGLLQLMFV